MRQIDADALKKEFCKDIMGGLNWERIIDNAPTVIPSLNLDNITEDDIEKFKMVWQRATSKGLLVISEDRPHGEWIAVKDKLPDTDGEYLVSLDNGRIVVADERGIIENHDFEPKMMAWQPLPEPYRAEVDT